MLRFFLLEIDNIYMIGCELLEMILELVPRPYLDVRVCSVSKFSESCNLRPQRESLFNFKI